MGHERPHATVAVLVSPERCGINPLNIVVAELDDRVRAVDRDIGYAASDRDSRVRSSHRLLRILRSLLVLSFAPQVFAHLT